MPNYITCCDLKMAKETKEKLIRGGHPNTRIETIVKGKEYRVHPGENPSNGKFAPPGKLSEEVNKD
jgi:hypothetical protein